MSAEVLLSHWPALDNVFARRGGLRPGKTVEWGAPIGRGGRWPILQLLKHCSEPMVWISGHSEGAQIYPPAWAQMGIDLSKCSFIRTLKPLPDLRVLFLEPVFKIIVLDHPEKLSRGDWSFMSAQVRALGQILFVIRPFFLSTKRGNPLAHWRFNSWFNVCNGQLCIKTIRGGEEFLSLPITDMRRAWDA